MSESEKKTWKHARLATPEDSGSRGYTSNLFDGEGEEDLEGVLENANRFCLDATPVITYVDGHWMPDMCRYAWVLSETPFDSAEPLGKSIEDRLAALEGRTASLVAKLDALHRQVEKRDTEACTSKGGEVEYREPVLPQDLGKQCEFKDGDGEEWLGGELSGYIARGASDSSPWGGWINEYGDAWEMCRIRA